MIQAMKKPSRCEVWPGVTLARGKNGSVSVLDHGHLAGWLHASHGSDWKAIVASEPSGVEIWKFKEDGAIRAIVREFRVKQRERLVGNASA